MRIGLAITLLVLAAALSWFGTPHIRVDQTCRSYDGGRSCAWVVSCTYLGIQGHRKVFPEWEPEPNLCPAVAWFPLELPLSGGDDAAAPATANR
jgi:hypothetical protein